MQLQSSHLAGDIRLPKEIKSLSSTYRNAELATAGGVAEGTAAGHTGGEIMPEGGQVVGSCIRPWERERERDWQKTTWMMQASA